MANVVSGNTIYMDSTGAAGPASRAAVAYLVMTPNGTNSQLIIRDASSSTQTKFSFKIADGNSRIFRFEEFPVLFPNGIDVGTITACVATAVLKGIGG